MLALDPLGAPHLEVLRLPLVEGLDVAPHVRALVGVAHGFAFGLRPFVAHPCLPMGPFAGGKPKYARASLPTTISGVSGPSIRARAFAGMRSRPRPCPRSADRRSACPPGIRATRRSPCPRSGRTNAFRARLSAGSST